MSSSKWWYILLGTTLANTSHQIKSWMDEDERVSRLEVVNDMVASRSLLKAAYNDDVDAFVKAMEKGNINARNEDGDNFLMIAIKHNSNKILEYVSDKENGVWQQIDFANVNNDGKTAEIMVKDKLNSVMGYIDGSSKSTLGKLKNELSQNKSKVSMAFYEGADRSIR